MKRFENKVCFVTASTQGIGFGISERMAMEGGKVIICSRREKNVNEALDRLKDYNVEGYICNIGKQEERAKVLKAIREKHGKIDVLVCNHACSTHFGTQLMMQE